ncbi:fimbrial protein [Dyella koreensis]|uniref:Fimbrial protein n=1 Tax=Dyella koreensis TaxID=311235 RepID=A0ABW8JZI7_9GAMM
MGDTPFALTVNNCQYNPSFANFTFTGTADGSNGVIFKNSADAPGVGVRLFTTSDNQTIGANGTTNVRSVPVAGGQAVLGLTAQYYKTGASVGAGQVSSRITVAMSYN